MTVALIPFTAAGPLSRQWFGVASSATLDDGPEAVRLLGNDLVLWRSPSGTVVVAPDKCTHSKRQLSKGTVDEGRLACPKHGWTFGDEGRCIFKPSGLPITDNAHLKTYPCTERYGLIWMALGDPEASVIDLPWDDDPRYRRIHSEVSAWAASPVHVIETILAKTDSEPVDVSAELPFSVHTRYRSDDGSEHRRLVTCAPVNSRASRVATVVWTTAPDADDAKVVEEVTSDLEEVRSVAESMAAPSPAVETAATPDENALSQDWKHRLSDLASSGT